jgi:hypothetical protein
MYFRAVIKYKTTLQYRSLKWSYTLFTQTSNINLRQFLATKEMLFSSYDFSTLGRVTQSVARNIFVKINK